MLVDKYLNQSHDTAKTETVGLFLWPRSAVLRQISSFEVESLVVTNRSPPVQQRPVLDQSRIKDLRTKLENTNTQAVLDGDLDAFIEASLKSGL